MAEKTEVKMSSPWYTLFREIVELFRYDSDIFTDFNEETMEIKLYVGDKYKADALEQLLPKQKVYGNVVVTIKVISGDKVNSNKLALFDAAFKDNPIYSYAAGSVDQSPFNINWVVFKNQVVQFFNDDMSDVNGNCSTLYQEIAKDVFGEIPGINFCTDTPDNLGKPLHKWP